MSQSNTLLIVVHPGSACGSADMNLGRDNADMQRCFMQTVVEGWEGGIVIIDGELSDELAPNSGRDAWDQWGRALDNAIERARQNGHLSLRVMGDDGGMSELNQMEATRKVVEDYALTPENTAITLTGAWIDDEGGGCVHSVREELAKLGFQARIEDAMDLDFETAEEELDEEEDHDYEVRSERNANTEPAPEEDGEDWGEDEYNRTVGAPRRPSPR